MHYENFTPAYCWTVVFGGYVPVIGAADFCHASCNQIWFTEAGTYHVRVGLKAGAASGKLVLERNFQEVASVGHCDDGGQILSILDLAPGDQIGVKIDGGGYIGVDDIVVTVIKLGGDLEDSLAPATGDHQPIPSSIVGQDSWMTQEQVEAAIDERLRQQWESSISKLNKTLSDYGLLHEKLEESIEDHDDTLEALSGATGVMNDRIAKVDANTTSGLANLACAQARSEKRIKELEGRIAELEAAEAEVIEIAPVPLGKQLKRARTCVDGRKTKLSDGEKLLDKYVHTMLDEDARLKNPGGWFVLENLGEDMPKRFPELTELDLDFAFEAVIQSALRWCKRRSKWYTRRRYWVQEAGDWLVVKHDRFWFRPERVEQDRDEPTTKISTKGSKILRKE